MTFTLRNIAVLALVFLLAIECIVFGALASYDGDHHSVPQWLIGGAIISPVLTMIGIADLLRERRP